MLGQLFWGEWAVRVSVEPVRGRGVSLARHQPAGPVVGVPVPLVVAGHYVQQHQVPGQGDMSDAVHIIHTTLPSPRPQVGEAHPDGGEHPPA